MKYKRLTAGLLAVTLSVGGIGAMPVIAAEKPSSVASTAESDAMQKAILDVKSRVTIPAVYSDFDYTTNTTYGIPRYTFYWRDLKDDNSKWDCPTIRVDYVNGMITAYSYSDGTYDRGIGFAKLSDSDLKSAALKYFKQLNPKLSGTVEVASDGVLSLIGNTVYYTVSRKEQGVAVDDNIAVIGVDKNTGKLISASFSWFIGARFDDASKRVSVESANQAYRAETGLKAEYKLYTSYDYDEKTKKYTATHRVKAVYIPENIGRNEIDAITGKYTAYYDDMELYEKTYAYDWGTGSMLRGDATESMNFAGISEKGVAPTLTSAETKAIKDESRFITQEQVNKIVDNDPYIKTEKGMVLKSRAVREVVFNGKTSYDLDVTYVLDTNENNITLNVTLDALTGKVQGFSKNYGSKTYDNKAIAESSAKSKTAELAKYYMGSKADGYTFDNYNADTDKTVAVSFKRVVNGIDAPFDTVEVSIAPDGEILGFAYEHHDIAFPSGALIGEDKAYSGLLSKYPATLTYIGFVDLQLVPHTYLTYTYPTSFTLDAFTGTRLGYNGEPYKEEEEQEYLSVQYKDIKGHKYEKEIQRCVDYGIYATLDDTLNPDEAITVEEWGMMLSVLRRGVPLDTEHLDNVARTETVVGTLEKFGWGIEDNAVLKSKLTNKDMAKFFVGMMGNFDYLAEQPIFEAPYSDISKNDPYCGYIAIAKAYGLTQDTNGKFNPDKELTKADCYKLMYDWLSSESTEDGRFELVCGVLGLN